MMADQSKSKSGKSTFDPVTNTWTWTTKKGKVVTRSNEEYQKQIKVLQMARMKKMLEGPKEKKPKDDQPTSSKKMKAEDEQKKEEKEKKEEMPAYIKKMLKEIKMLKSEHTVVQKQIKPKPAEQTDGDDEDDVLVLDRRNKEHAKIIGQPGIEEVSAEEHENEEASAHDKAFKSLLFQDASVIVPVHDQVTEDDKKNITEKPELYTAIFEFDGERLDETEPKFVPAPTGKSAKRKLDDDGNLIKIDLFDDDDNNMVVCNDIISHGKIEIDEAIAETDFSQKVCVPRLASLKCELVQLPRTKVLPTGFNQAAVTHPETGTTDDNAMKFDVWVANVPMVTKKIDAICATHISEVDPSNIKDTPWGEDPFSRQDFEIRAGAQPDNLEDVIWHGEYQATTTTFYESGIIGDKSVPVINDVRKEVELVNNDTDVQTFIQDTSVDVGKFLPTGCLHVYEKYFFQNKNNDITVPPVDTNDLISVQYLQSQAKFRITMQYYLTYWTPLYFLDNPHFDGRKYRPDVTSSYTVTMSNDDDEDDEKVAALIGESYTPSWSTKVGRRHFKASFDKTKSAAELWDNRHIRRLVTEKVRLTKFPKVIRSVCRHSTTVPVGGILVRHRLRDWLDTLSGVFKCVGSLGGSILGALFKSDEKGRLVYMGDPTAPVYFPNSFRAGTYTPSLTQKGKWIMKRVKDYAHVLSTCTTFEEARKVCDNLLFDASGPSLDRCNVGSENEYNFLPTVNRFKDPSNNTETGYDVSDDTDGQVIDQLPIMPSSFKLKNVAVGATLMMAHPNTGNFDPFTSIDGSGSVLTAENMTNPPVYHEMAIVPLGCDTLRSQFMVDEENKVILDKQDGSKTLVQNNIISGCLTTTKSVMCQNAFSESINTTTGTEPRAGVECTLPVEFFGAAPSATPYANAPYTLRKLPGDVSMISVGGVGTSTMYTMPAAEAVNIASNAGFNDLSTQKPQNVISCVWDTDGNSGANIIVHTV